MSAEVFRFPRTAAGRETLRDVLFCLRRCGPPPDGRSMLDDDWDEIGAAVQQYFQDEEKEARR